MRIMDRLSRFARARPAAVTASSGVGKDSGGYVRWKSAMMRAVVDSSGFRFQEAKASVRFILKTGRPSVGSLVFSSA